MANRQSAPHNDILQRMKAKAAWRLKQSDLLQHCAAYDPKRSLHWGIDEKPHF